MAVYRPKYRDPKNLVDFRFKHRFASRTEGIRWLIEAALKAKLAPKEE